MSKMSKSIELENKVESFLLEVEDEDHITASTVVYTAIRVLEVTPAE